MTNAEDNVELLSAATKLAEMNIAIQQLSAKYNIIMAAIGPFTVRQLQIWQKNIEDMLDETNIQHLSGLAHMLAQMVRAKSFVEKFEADIKKTKGEIDGTVQAE